MNMLIEESIQIHRKFAAADFIVKPSIPVVFFGDSGQYFKSELRIITVGLNPSKLEFPEDERLLRFPNMKNIHSELLQGKRYTEYLCALNSYFRNAPYKKWFNSFECLLNGMDCSYYDKADNTALHTDLCSPLATDPTWTKLSREQQTALESGGVRLWHNLVRYLSPHIILISVAKKYMTKIEFPKLQNWRTLCVIQRKNPYEVKSSKMKTSDSTESLVIHGKAANIPFGLVSAEDRRKIGSLIRKHFYGKER